MEVKNPEIASVDVISDESSVVSSKSMLSTISEKVSNFFSMIFNTVCKNYKLVIVCVAVIVLIGICCKYGFSFPIIGKIILWIKTNTWDRIFKKNSTENDETHPDLGDSITEPSK